MTGAAFPRIVIAASSSGTGKTTLAAGLMAAFRRRGLRVQPFKAGPDYIDPGFHTLAAGRESRNLDTRLMPRSALAEIFRRAAGDADLSIIEGVMGLFDGAGPLDERGSTAHLAKILRAPTVVLLDIRSMARSAGALALGFQVFDRRVPLAGFILNRAGSPNHLHTAKTAVENAVGLPVFGGLPADPSLSLPERHLGLVPAWEARSSAEAAGRWREYISSLADRIEAAVDMDALLAAARSAPEPPRAGTRLFGGITGRRKAGTRIAYALDDAFHFYYPDNLDILRRYGAEPVPFSPLRDSALPPDIRGLYLGGGYPELHAQALSSNTGMLTAIRSAAREGMPVLAECGGYMYLSRSIKTFDGRSFPMAGLLPVRALMGKKLGALGYQDAVLLSPCFLGSPGESCPGHVFHYSVTETVDETGETPAPLFRLEKPGREARTDGIAAFNIAASYLHIHFASRPLWAKRFVDACRRHRKETKNDSQKR